MIKDKELKLLCWYFAVVIALYILFAFAVVWLYYNLTPAPVQQEEAPPAQQAETIKEPSQVVGVSRGSATSRTITVEATAYLWTGNKTATGTWPRRGTIAVDPKVIPLGTILYIPGYGYGKAEDTGGRIKGNTIDLFMGNRTEAINWGRRTIEIKIVKE